jgi:hypothetical protein
MPAQARHQTGNFPQALTHTALINTAQNLCDAKRASAPAVWINGMHCDRPQFATSVRNITLTSSHPKTASALAHVLLS